MKKIPTVFVRKFENHKIVEVLNEITPGCEEAFLHGYATIKYDGTCCMINENGELFRRYDAKAGKTPPEGAIACCDPDPITGHWPHWIKVDVANPKPDEKWIVKAWAYTRQFGPLAAGTYEAIGKHFNGNPYDKDNDELIAHGEDHILFMDRTYEAVKEKLRTTDYEGIVFWLNGEPVCKIKRTDFGFEWPVKIVE